MAHRDYQLGIYLEGAASRSIGPPMVTMTVDGYREITALRCGRAEVTSAERLD